MTSVQGYKGAFSYGEELLASVFKQMTDFLNGVCGALKTFN